MHEGGNMGYCYAVFTSRSETLSFANYLKRMGIPCMVASTPKSAGRACGISVKFLKDYRDIVAQSLAKMAYRSFKGIIEA